MLGGRGVVHVQLIACTCEEAKRKKDYQILLQIGGRCTFKDVECPPGKGVGILSSLNKSESHIAGCSKGYYSTYF
jgi:hypothetical protein